MPLPLVDKIHFAFTPVPGTLPDALAEAKHQVAGLAGFEMTAVEFEGGTIIDVDALPTINEPLDMRLFRTRAGDWGWQFYTQHGRTSVEATTVQSMLEELLEFIANNGGPSYALLNHATGVVLS